MKNDNKIVAKELSDIEIKQVKRTIDAMRSSLDRDTFIGNVYGSKYSIDLNIDYFDKKQNVCVFNDTIPETILTLISNLLSLKDSAKEVSARFKEFSGISIGWKLVNPRDTILPKHQESFSLWRFIYLYKDSFTVTRDSKQLLAENQSRYIVVHNLEYKGKKLKGIVLNGNQIYILYRRKIIVLYNYDPIGF